MSYINNSTIFNIFVYFGFIIQLKCFCLLSGTYINSNTYEELVVITNPYENNVPPLIILQNKTLIPTFIKLDKTTKQVIGFDLLYSNYKLNYILDYQNNNSFIQEQGNFTYFLNKEIFEKKLGHYWLDYHQYQKDAYLWCNISKTTPEPDLLIYNRIGKCGSTTIEKIIDYIVSKYDEYKFYRVPERYWGIDLDKNVDLRNDFIKSIRNQNKYQSKLFVSGHLHHTKYNPKDFSSRNDFNIQHMNILRNCPERRKSHFLFTTFDSPMAHRAIASNPKLSKEQVYMKILNSNISSDQCIQSRECLLNSQSSSLTDTYIDYFCASKCTSMHKSHIDGALYNELNPREYILMGILEYFKQFWKCLNVSSQHILRIQVQSMI